MDGLFHRAGNFYKKRLIPLVLICTMLISVAPLHAMAAKEKPKNQTAASLNAEASEDRTLVKNWGFESGDLSGWTVLTPGWGTDKKGSPTGVVSARSDGESGAPTNQSGSYHLSGLHNGIPGVEGWAVRSSSFLLSGSGWISVKMGGQAAAVKVFLSDGTQTGYYRTQGVSSNEMATYVMDLSEYLGRELYLVLCDEVTGSSSAALFDDVITCYDAAPDPTFRFDTVTDGYEVQIPWVMGYNLFQPCTENDVKNGGFESGDLTGWTVLTEGFNASTAVVNEQTYWAQELPYNQSGFYHLNGWSTGIPEAQGWAVRSSSFVLGGSGYISVKMGGNAAAAKVFLSDGTQIGEYRNFRFRDVSFPYIAQGGAWCDMATYVIDLSDYLGKEMYIELHDEVIHDGWANAFFDDVVTCYETAPEVSGRFDKVPDGHQPGEIAKTAQIPWVLVPKASGEAPRQIPNGDFETGDLSGWTVYGSGFPIRNGLPAASSEETYWDQELPFNKSGDYFLNGWALSGNEANTWRVRSSPFTLEGSGWISVKMGGRAAAVRVYRMDGTLVGDFDQSRFCDREFPYLSKGGSWCEMATYLLDLTPNIGEVLYIELCDVSVNGGWANAFFDDVVTYYAKKPEPRSEWVQDGHKPGEKAKRVSIPAVVGVNNLYNPRNSGFELGDLTGWTVVEGTVKLNTAVVAAKDYNLDVVVNNVVTDARKLPYNTSGNFLLSGHDATNFSDVGPENEKLTWTIRSSPFTLAGSGYISIKMGGAAAAFQVRTAEDNKLIAYCQQRRFSDINFPYLSKGGSWRDMAAYVMDLSDFLGQKLVIELMDEEVNTGWGDAYFDDIITYYPKRPTTWADTVTDGYHEYTDTPKEINIPWLYLDEYYDGVVSRFPPSPSELTPLKEISSQKTPGETVNLYEYFTTEQGLSGYDLEGSRLTFTSVKQYKINGNVSTVGSARYSSLRIEEGYYVAEYQFRQAEKTYTGSFVISAVTPDTEIPDTNNKLFNGGFESGSLAGWTTTTPNFNAGTAVISAQTYWDRQLPYNQAGNYHLDGWNTGIAESGSWSVKSSTFTLGGSGYISWRMGGHAAAVKIFKADGTEIAHVQQSRFADHDFPDVNKGSWNDMATYVLDLSAFKGEKLYIELHDEANVDGWANAFFDEVVTYYTSEPRLGRTDTVRNSNGCTPAAVDIPWVYVDVNTALKEDTKPFKFEGTPKNQVLNPSAPDIDIQNVNLADMLKGTTAKYNNSGDDVEVKITKVLFNGEELEGTTSPKTRAAEAVYYDLSRPGTYQIFYRAFAGEKSSWEMSFSVMVHDENSNTIPNGGFESGDLSGWTVTAGNFDGKTPVISAETYWDNTRMPYNQAGNYHLGGQESQTGIPENATWAVKSSTFKLDGSGYISVRMGGHAAVEVYKADNNVQVARYENIRFKDVSHPNVAVGSWLDMGTYVMDLSQYKGEKLYIVLRDERDSNWGYATFDEVVTYYATAPDWEHMSDSVTNSNNSGIVNIDWQLAGEESANPGQSAPANAQITNGGFEDGNLTGWTTTTPNFNSNAAVISAKTYWGEKLPYNQAGRYHLDGWQTGIGEGESWSVKSSTFTLQGSGYISVRMGGKAAAVKVYTANDNTMVGYYKQTRFSDTNFPSVASGSWADMGTYVMDLSSYINEELYIELCDEVVEGGWAHAFFDEVVTYYETEPDWENSSDTVADGGTGNPVNIPWRLAENAAPAPAMEIAMMALIEEELEEKADAMEAPDITGKPDAAEAPDAVEVPAPEDEKDPEDEGDSEDEEAPEDEDDSKDEETPEDGEAPEDKGGIEDESNTEDEETPEDKGGTEDESNTGDEPNTEDEETPKGEGGTGDETPAPKEDEAPAPKEEEITTSENEGSPASDGEEESEETEGPKASPEDETPQE